MHVFMFYVNLFIHSYIQDCLRRRKDLYYSLVLPFERQFAEKQMFSCYSTWISLHLKKTFSFSLYVLREGKNPNPSL